MHKQVLDACIRRLLPQPRVGANNLPSTAIVTVRAQRADLIVHLLHYVPQRRGKNLDVVEDILPLHDVALAVRSARRPSAVNLVPEGRPLEWTYADGYVSFTLPCVDGYQIVQIVRDLTFHADTRKEVQDFAYWQTLPAQPSAFSNQQRIGD